jgi:CDP-glucose 4,6-dehydratase
MDDVVSAASMNAFGGVFRGKRVLVTGHTGFKGGWLATWLMKLGADVIGVARDVPTQPSMFVELGLQQRLVHHQLDIRDLPRLRAVVASERPDFVFHLAAQAIVSTSYRDPVDTISSNAIGTMNLLESVRAIEHPCVAVLITSDKCYDNVEWVWGYRETDALGGKDIYSGSKAAAEVIIRSYVHCFFQGKDGPVRIGVGRAGNVIGGGDWARDRLVVDCMRAWSEGRAVEIRSPRATRPWQHVLEPLSGYLRLAQALHGSAALHGEAFNFGPRAEQNRAVVDLLSDLAQRWNLDAAAAYRVVDDIPFHEAGLLKLNCDKALLHLRWQPTWDYAATIRHVSDWYREFYRGRRDRMLELTMEQIDSYQSDARASAAVWVPT